MKKYFYILAVLVILPFTKSFAGDYSNTYVSQIFLESPTQLRFQLSSYSSSGWFYVKESIVGATMFDKIHAQLLSALVNNKLVWVGTQGTTTDVWATTIYR
jgi:hypothetical protein